MTKSFAWGLALASLIAAPDALAAPETNGKAAPKPEATTGDGLLQPTIDVGKELRRGSRIGARA